MAGGPVVIAYDGTPAADRALRAAAELMTVRQALVLVVWKQGLGFELLELPASTIGLPPAPLDIAAGLEVDRELAEHARRLAQKAAGRARELGLEADALAVADDPGTEVWETVVRVARERDARAVVIGSHGAGGIGEVVLGSTTRDVIRHAPAPVLAVREPDEG